MITFKGLKYIFGARFTVVFTTNMRDCTLREYVHRDSTIPVSFCMSQSLSCHCPIQPLLINPTLRETMAQLFKTNDFVNEMLCCQTYFFAKNWKILPKKMLKAFGKPCVEGNL